jgi:transcriptional regulator with XRE-family HTH domain
MDLRVVVGRNIKVIRQSAGIAQDELAHRAEIHVTYLSGVENGHRNITMDVLERIAAALGVAETTLVARHDG